MRENGTTLVKSISKFLRKLFGFLKRKRKRSSQSLITPSIQRIDTKGEMQKIELGRDNMEEFVRMVPDECIVDLSHRWYCVYRENK